MKDSVFFWSTIFFGAAILFGLFILALHSSPSLYQGFLRLCGVNSTTCARIVQTVNPLTILSTTVLLWVAVVFFWQISRTQVFLYRKSRQTYPLPNTLRVLGLRHRLQGHIIVVPGNALFCAGILRRRIYIGRDLLRDLSKSELEAALIHESYHLRKHDPLKILIVSTLAKSFFFLPAVRELTQAYLREKEISADRLAESTVGRKHLSRALIKAFRHGADESPGVPGFTAGLTTLRSSGSFSGWGWGLTILLVGLGWIVIKNSITQGGCS